MGVIIVSDIGLEKIEQGVQDIEWFMYMPGSLNAGSEGEDGFRTFLQSPSLTVYELEKKIIEILDLKQQSEYRWLFEDKFIIRKMINRKENQNWFMLEFFGVDTYNSINEDVLAALYRIDQKLGDLDIEFAPHSYIVDPIYGPKFRGKDKLYKANGYGYWPKREGWWLASEWSSYTKDKVVPQRMIPPPRKSLLSRLTSLFK